MFKLDLKRAEVAIEGGRLDQAFTLLQNSPQAKHADGQRLIERLVDAYIDRANLHLADDRLEAAQADSEKANVFAGNRVDIAEIQGKVASRRDSAAGKARAANADASLGRIKAIAKHGDHEAIVDWLADQSLTFHDRPELESLVQTSVGQLISAAEKDFTSGRLDRCQTSVDRLKRFGAQRQEIVELNEQLDRCRLAASLSRELNFEVAIRELKLASQISPKATWITAAIESLEQCEQGLRSTCSGPLGLLESGAAFPSAKPDSVADRAPKRRRQAAELEFQLPKSCGSSPHVLQVDQLGGVLLLRDHSISIGTPSIARSSDIVLQTDGLKAKITITRDGEDYFATSNEGFFVNQTFAKRHVLSPADTIAVGSRGRLKFLRPMPASNSPVLLVQGAKLRRRDIRGIVLVDESVVFGDSGCHFAVPDLPRRVIVQPAGMNQYWIHEKGSTDRQLLKADQVQDVAGIQFALQHESPTSRERIS